MKTITTSKLTRKCLILAFMILGLVFATSSDRLAQPVAATQCCETCPGDGDPSQADTNCGITCLFVDPTGGSVWHDCFDECSNSAFVCYNHCVFCNSGGGGGSACNSSSDCPINYFCGADNTCQHF